MKFLIYVILTFNLLYAMPKQETSNSVMVNGVLYENKPFTIRYNWEEANTYCRDLDFNGYSDWRLPTKDDLSNISIVPLHKWEKYSIWHLWFEENKELRLENSTGDKHFILEEFIENMPTYSWFWTSDEYDKNSSFAYTVDFEGGNYSKRYKLAYSYVLCVR